MAFKEIQMGKVYTQAEVMAAVDGKKQFAFERDAERSAIIVTPENQIQVQKFIDLDILQIGSFDKTSYEESGYFEDGVIKVGMAVMINAEDDIYINPKFKYNGENDNRKFSDMPFVDMIRTYTVTESRKMVKAADAFDGVVTIEAPWGGTQEVRKDGWINIGRGEVYAINSENGIPAGGFVAV